MKNRYVTPEHKECVQALLPQLVQIIQEYDGLVEPDAETLVIIQCCLGYGFSIGVAYGQADPALPPMERLSKAFELIQAGAVT